MLSIFIPHRFKCLKLSFTGKLGHYPETLTLVTFTGRFYFYRSKINE